MAVDRLDVLWSDFLRDLAIAWRALASYPSGHPTIAGSLQKAIGALQKLLDETGSIEVTAAREALHWGDRRFTAPTAVQLARLLRRRRAAAVALDPGIHSTELEIFLRALGLDAIRAREAGSLAAELAAAGLVHLRVADLDFSALALIEGEEALNAPEAGAFASRVIRRLLANGSLAPDQLASWITSGKSAAELLQYLFDTGGNGPATGTWGPAAFAAALTGTAEELCSAVPVSSVQAGVLGALHQRLRAEDRDRLMQEVAAAAGRQGAARESLEQLTSLLSPQIAGELRLAVGRAAARGAGSPSTAEAGDRRSDGETAAAPAAPRIAPQQLASLRRAFAGEDVDALDNTPSGASAAATVEVLLELPEDRTDLPLPAAAAEVARELLEAAHERTVTVALLELVDSPDVPPETLAPLLHRLEIGYRRLLTSGRMRQALALVERVQAHAAAEGASGTAFRRSAERLSGRDSLEALVTALPELSEESLKLVPALLARLGATASRHLLGVLAEADNRRMRHLLLDLLEKLGPAVVRDATSLLSDSRWYVVRNMLLLLRRVGDPGSVPAVRKCADHPDLRVRLEAIRNLFAFDPDVPRELLRRALTHRDPRQAEAAMELAGEHGIVEAVEPIVSYLRARDPFGVRRAIRIKAIRALAAIGNPAALDGLARYRARFQLLPPAIEERREVYRTLASYPPESRASWIESGVRSRDAEVRRLATALARQQNVPAGEKPA